MPQRAQLIKSIGYAQALALAIGSIIGWGCFILPATHFLPNAGPGGATLAFAIGALFQCAIAHAHSVLISAHPVAGGAFAYAYAGFGHAGAFICGWAMLINYICLISANAMAAIILTRHLCPGLFAFGHLYSLAGSQIHAGEIALVSSLILTFAIINIRGASLAAILQVTLALVIIAGSLSLAIGTSLAPTSQPQNLLPFFAPDNEPIAGILIVLALTPWLYIGYDTIPQTAEEFRFHPDKARGLMFMAIFCGALIYILVTLSVAGHIPWREFIARDYPWATGQLAQNLFGSFGAAILAIAVLAAILTGINAYLLAAARLLFSMGRSGFLPHFLADLHPRSKTPGKGIALTAALCLIAPWLGQTAVTWIVEMSVIGTATAWLLTCLTASRSLKASEKGISRLVCLLGAATSLAIFALLFWPGSPAAMSLQSWATLLLWIIIGLPFYLQSRTAMPDHLRHYLIFGKKSVN